MSGKRFRKRLSGTGVPMTQKETEGRKGKQENGSAKTREAKLGCVFTQTRRDGEGRPIRDPASTTFTGAIEPAAVVGTRIYCEAVRRVLFAALCVVVLTDGAEWICNITQLHFSGTLHIIALRCVTESGRLEDYWEQRSA